MANGLYAQAKQLFLGASAGAIHWLDHTIKATLVSSSYTPDLSTHQFVSSITAHTGSVTAQTLTNKTSTGGVADADDVTFTAVAAGSVWSYVVLWKDTSGATSTSPLICCFDTITGLPLTSSGADVTVRWDSGSNKIFRL